MPYADLFIAPIPAEQANDYTAFCEITQKMMLGYGAISCSDFWADDVQDGDTTSLLKAVKLQEGETVAMGWVLWPDKAARDAGWARMMAEPQDMELPFDGKRMIFGGFSGLMETHAE